ncbi:MAG: tetratricopeptide repeat protein [Bacteroidota bacterium]
MKLIRIYISILLTICLVLPILLWGQDRSNLEQSFQEANSLLKEGEEKQAVIIFQQILEEIKGEQNPYIKNQAQLNLARIYRGQNNFSLALKYYLEADLDLQKDTLNPAYIQTHTEMGSYYHELGLDRNAIEYIGKAYTLAQKNPSNFDLNAYRKQLGFLYLQVNQFDSAQFYLQEAFAVSAQGKDTLQMIVLQEQLGNIFLQKGDYKSALGEYLAISKLSNKANLPDRNASALNNVGYTLFRMEEFNAALDNFNEAYELDKKAQASNLILAKDLSNIGIANQALEKPSEAIDQLLNSSSLYQKEKEWEELVKNYHILAKIYLYQKDYYNAGIYLDKAFDLVGKYPELASVTADINETASTVAQERNDFKLALNYYQKHLRIKDSLRIAERLMENNRQRDIQNLLRREEEFRQLIAGQKVRELRYAQLELEKEKDEQRINLMEQDAKLQASLQREQELENERALQLLQGERDRLFAERQASEIQNLQQQQKLKDLELSEKKREESERILTIEKLEREQALNDSELARLESRRTFVQAIGILMALLLLAMLAAIYVNRRANKRLKEKNDAIEENRAELSNTLGQLKSAQSQLVQSEKMASLGQLTAGIAHEINNPVNFISGGISALNRNLADIREVLDKYEEITPENADQVLSEIKALKEDIEFEDIMEEVDELSTSISQGAIQTASIVKGLRTFSRLDEGDLKYANLHDNLDSTLIMLKNQIKKKVEIVKNYGKIPAVQCYPGKLNQVFMNLLSNAIQAIEGQGKITLTTSQEGERVNIQIVDTGKGMSQEVQNRIFEPFYTTKEIGKGTGLGLAISLGIIQDHNATIQVDSEEGRGTAFTISLPINQ